MGWLSRLFGAVPKEEMKGIHLDTTGPYWEIDGPKTFVELFNALQDLLPEGAILYFEDGSADTQIDDFFNRHSMPEVSHVAGGTIWPRPKVFHVPAKTSILSELSEMMKHHVDIELAIHFHVYLNDSILLEWHDVFSQPMLISAAVSEEKVKVFADKIGKSYKKVVG